MAKNDISRIALACIFSFGVLFGAKEIDNNQKLKNLQDKVQTMDGRVGMMGKEIAHLRGLLGQVVGHPLETDQDVINTVQVLPSVPSPMHELSARIHKLEASEYGDTIDIDVPVSEGVIEERQSVIPPMEEKGGFEKQ